MAKNILKVIFTKQLLTKVTIFRCFDVCSVRPPQVFQVQAKISTVWPVFPDYLSVSYDNEHIKKRCRKAGQNLRLTDIIPSLDTYKRKAIYTTMVKSQLNYCPLIWIFCPRRSNNLINKVQKRALRIAYNDRLTDF